MEPRTWYLIDVVFINGTNTQRRYLYTFGPSCEVTIFWEDQVNTMAIDALAPCVARPSEAMGIDCVKYMAHAGLWGGRSAITCNFSYYCGVTMSAVGSQMKGIWTVCSAACSGTRQRRYQSFVWLVFVRRTHRWPVGSPHKGPVTRKMFLFVDVIISTEKGEKIQIHFVFPLKTI